MAKRKRHLNILNSDRIYNLNLTTRQEEAKFIKVTRLNEKAIEKDMDKLKKESKRYNKRDENNYLLYKQRYSNDTLYEKVMDHGGYVYYYTSDRAPIPIINKLAGVPQSEVIFYCKKEHSLEDVINVQYASMATKVTIDVPIVLPDINPYDYLFSLYPLRYFVDKVKISFPALREEEIQPRHKKYYIHKDGMYYLKANYKYECFKHLQDPLSVWKMNIWLVCDSNKDIRLIEELVKKESKRVQSINTKDEPDEA